MAVGTCVLFRPLLEFPFEEGVLRFGNKLQSNLFIAWIIFHTLPLVSVGRRLLRASSAGVASLLPAVPRSLYIAPGSQRAVSWEGLTST